MKEKETSRCISKIKESIKKQYEINDLLKELLDQLEYAKKHNVEKILDEIFNLMLIKYNKDVIIMWRKMIQHYKCRNMMDRYFDFYWITRKERNIANEIIILYKEFGIYFLKYMRELKNIGDFKDVVVELEKEYLKYVENYKTDYLCE